MLHACDFGDIEQTSESFIVKHFSVRRKPRAEFKSQHLGIAERNCAIRSCLFSRGPAMQSRRLKDDGNAAYGSNRIHLLAIEWNGIPNIIFDESTRNERNVVAKSFPGPAQHVEPFCGAVKIHIT